MSGVTELGLAYAAMIGLIGAYVYRLVIRLYDLDARLAAVEDACLLYTSPSPRDVEESRMPSSA